MLEIEIEKEESGEKKGKYPGFKDYEVESAADLLLRAQEIKDNPELMAAVEICLAKKEKSIRSISDLKSARASKNNYKNEMPEKEMASDEAESE